MSHSHLAIRHLVKQLELSRESGETRQPLPTWLIDFVEEVAELFEPFSGVARAGYECMSSDTGWEVAMFLGEHEIVGGAMDGHMQAVNFRFNISDFYQRFDSIEAFHWNAFPNSHVCFEDSTDLSFMTVDGIVNGSQIRLQIHAAPPETVGPALKQHQDGRVEVV